MTKETGATSTAETSWVSADPSKGRIDRDRVRRYDPAKDVERLQYHLDLDQWEREQQAAERLKEAESA